MIEARQRPDEQHRTNRGCPWVATCESAGTSYTARSRSGAPYALARILVAAGIPDQSMALVSQGIAGETRFRSIQQMAGYTIAESATHPVHIARWRPYEDKGQPQDAGQFSDVSLNMAVEAAQAPSASLTSE